MRRGALLASVALAIAGCADGANNMRGGGDVASLNGAAGLGPAAGAGGSSLTDTAGAPALPTAGAPAPAAGAPAAGAPAPTAGAPAAGAPAPAAGAPAAGNEPMPVAGWPAPTAGTQAPPAAGTPATDPPANNNAMPAPAGSSDPQIPAVTAQCPSFSNGTITFMGLGGIGLQAGAKAAGPTAPYVHYWHGTGSFSGEYAGMAGAVHAGVMAEGGVLTSFQGTTGGDLLSGTAIFGMGDLDLADQLTACAVQNHNVDPRRIFATGCSAGGLFSTAQAALRSNYMAAAAPNSGGLILPQQFTGFVPALMTIHGAPGIDVVVIDFSQSSATADMAFKSGGGFVINCNHGGGHCGGGGLAPDIWEFFKAHPYGATSPWAGGLPAGFNPACQIY